MRDPLSMLTDAFTSFLFGKVETARLPVRTSTGQAQAVYLPTAAYTEMGEWALPPAAAAELHDARARLAALPDGERLSRLLRGGFFRNFLIKYPEIGDAYWKMIRLSRRVHDGLTARPRDPRLLAARERLWQGQANDAYWHGVFGGCYLPHLRRAVDRWTELEALS